MFIARKLMWRAPRLYLLNSDIRRTPTRSQWEIYFIPIVSKTKPIHSVYITDTPCFSLRRSSPRGRSVSDYNPLLGRNRSPSFFPAAALSDGFHHPPGPAHPPTGSERPPRVHSIPSSASLHIPPLFSHTVGLRLPGAPPPQRIPRNDPQSPYPIVPSFFSLTQAWC